MTDTKELTKRARKVLKALNGLSHDEAVRLLEAAAVVVERDDEKLEVTFVNIVNEAVQ